MYIDQHFTCSTFPGLCCSSPLIYCDTIYIRLYIYIYITISQYISQYWILKNPECWQKSASCHLYIQNSHFLCKIIISYIAINKFRINRFFFCLVSFFFSTQSKSSIFSSCFICTGHPLGARENQHFYHARYSINILIKSENIFIMLYFMVNQ